MSTTTWMPSRPPSARRIAARRGPGGGFRLDVPAAVGPVHLSPGEIAALVASVASVGPYVSATAQSTLDRLVKALQPA